MPLDVGLVGHNVTTGDGQGNALLALAEALVTRGHRLTIYAQSVDRSTLQGVPIVALPRHRLPQAIVDALVFATATRAVRRRHHDVVCILGPSALPRPPFVYYAQFSQAGWRSTWTPSSRPQLYHRMHNWLGLQLERRVANRASLVLACSPAVGIELGAQGKRLRVVPNGVAEAFGVSSSEERTNARQALGIAPGEIAVALIGEFNTPRKGLDVLLAAIAKGPGDEHLLVAGAGPANRTRAKAKAVGLEGRVHLLGFTPARGILAAADVCAIPSRYEPFSLVALEAAIAGVPIALSGRAGVTEYLRDAVSVIDDPDDPGSVRQALDSARSQPAERTEAARMIAADLAWPRTAAHAAEVVEAAAELAR